MFEQLVEKVHFRKSVYKVPLCKGRKEAKQSRRSRYTRNECYGYRELRVETYISGLIFCHPLQRVIQRVIQRAILKGYSKGTPQIALFQRLLQGGVGEKRCLWERKKYFVRRSSLLKMHIASRSKKMSCKERKKSLHQKVFDIHKMFGFFSYIERDTAGYLFQRTAKAPFPS